MQNWLLRGAGALAIALLSNSVAQAADNWSIQPSIEEKGSWDSNPLLLTGSQKSLYGSITTPKLTIIDTTPTTTLNAQVYGSENIFNQSSFNSTDGHTNINLDKKMQQWEAGFVEMTDYDTTRTSEITTFNANTQGSVRHFGNSIAPTISYSPSTTDKISLTGSAADSHYDSSVFTNYRLYTVSPSYQYNFDALNIGSISLLGQRYQAESNTDAKITTIGPSLGWTGILTPRLTAKLSAGAEANRQEGSGVPSEQWRWETVYNGELVYKTIQDTLTVDAQRSLEPYANGTALYLNSVSFTETHTLNTLFSTNIGASYLYAGNSDQAATNLKSLVSANAGLTYHATDIFDVTASYQYRYETLSSVTDSASENVVMLSLVYHPKLDKLL